jgi:hypothetical protein
MLGLAPWYVSLLVAVAASSAAAPPSRPPPRVELIFEIRSYGEQPRDIVALLVPFLAKLRFSRAQRPSSMKIPDGAEAFGRLDGDFVITSGRFNCILIAYYSGYPGLGPDGAVPKDRAGAFAANLLDFLDGLPTPRPQPRQVTLGSKYCSDAT